MCWCVTLRVLVPTRVCVCLCVCMFVDVFSCSFFFVCVYEFDYLRALVGSCSCWFSTYSPSVHDAVGI